MNRLFHTIALIAVVALSLFTVYDGLFNKAGYFLPTFDNSMLHAGRARVIVDTGSWAEMELVFGAITKSYHLPLYPAFAAGVSGITGLDIWWAIRLASLLITGILFPLGFYVLAKHVSGGSWQAGVAAALVALNLPSLTTWGTRTSPISFGVVLVVFAVYFVARKEYLLAGLTGLALAMNHQPSLLAFGLSLFFYFTFNLLNQLYAEKKTNLRKVALESWPLFAVGALTLGAYLAWHLRQTGLTCLDFKCLPHLASHEYGSPVDLAKHLQIIPRLIAIAGVAWAALNEKMEFQHKVLLFSWITALFLLINNDKLGIAVFTERFLTFFDEALAVFAGLFIGWAYAVAADLLGHMKEGQKTRA